MGPSCGQWLRPSLGASSSVKASLLPLGGELPVLPWVPALCVDLICTLLRAGMGVSVGVPGFLCCRGKASAGAPLHVHCIHGGSARPGHQLLPASLWGKSLIVQV